VSLVDRIRDCARFEPGRYRPFIVGGAAVGRIDEAVAGLLRPFADVFDISEHSVTMNEGLKDPGQRTEAMAGVLEALRGGGHIPGWRDEAYPVGSAFSAPSLLTMERAAVPLFGVKGYGVHVNGFVRDGAGIKMWIGKRSLDKPTGPGKLDQIVAGGQPAGVSLSDNMIKECGEEAGIPAALAATARPVGTVSYMTGREEGLRDDVLFNYDLELPAGFEPANTDGEVEVFFLWPMAQVMDTLAKGDDFKFNCALVVIDFLVRWGFITPEDPDYIEIVQGVDRQFPAPKDRG
jgi:8-oxo-dGTP pyrophosphatase MutT (NUDIX family)|tara:strand:+ start:1790 stop:2662 length:873 start_codon:yes stop_codon:yes gene_type:complete